MTTQCGTRLSIHLSSALDDWRTDFPPILIGLLHYLSFLTQELFEPRQNIPPSPPSCGAISCIRRESRNRSEGMAVAEFSRQADEKRIMIT
jgi:hypothetical protein